MGKITRRKLKTYATGGKASFMPSTASAQLSNINRFYKDQIQGLESVRGQTKEARESYAREQKGVDSREENWSNTLNNFEGRITDIRIAANNVRSKNESDALLAKAKDLQKQQELWGDITSVFAKPLGEALAKTYEAYELAKARESYDEHDFTVHPAFEARDEALIGTIRTFHGDMAEQGHKYTYNENYNAGVKVSANAVYMHEAWRADDFENAKDPIIQSTHKVAIDSDGNNVWGLATYRSLLESRANAYLVKYDINPNSKAGVRIRKAASRWATELENNASLKKNGKDVIKQLTAGAKTVSIHIKNGDNKEAETAFNQMVFLVRNGVIQGGTKGDEWIHPSQHEFDKPQAAAYLTSFFLANNPYIDRKGLQEIYDNVRVPLEGKYKHLNISDEELDKRWKLALKIPGVKPEQEDTWKKNFRDRRREQAPTWGAYLGEEGATKAIFSKLDKQSATADTQRIDAAKSTARSDLNNYRSRYDLPKTINGEPNPDAIDLNDPEDTKILWTIASDPATHEIIRKGLQEDLDWDPTRQSKGIDVQYYKAALATLNYDDDYYYFSKLSDKDKEYYGQKHKSMAELRAAGITLEGARADLEGAVKGHYGNWILGKGVDNPTDLEKVVDHAAQRYAHYLNRLGDPENSNYIKHPWERHEEAINRVKEDIHEGVEKGIGIFAAEPIGKGGQKNLKWKNFSWSPEKTDLEAVNNALKDLLGGTYSWKKVQKAISAEDRAILEQSIVQGNAQKRDLPANLITIINKFGDTIKGGARRIINDAVMETEIIFDKEGKPVKGHKNMEVAIPERYEWPADINEIIQSNTSEKRAYYRTPTENVGFAIEHIALFDRPPMRKELSDYYDSRRTS